jgi:hypothetical protein
MTTYQNTIAQLAEVAETSRETANAAAARGDADAATCEIEAREDAETLALALCRGDYQKQIVTGAARLSGSDLKGEARRFSGRYAASRRAILARLDAYCTVGEVRGERGLRILTIDGVAV